MQQQKIWFQEQEGSKIHFIQILIKQEEKHYNKLTFFEICIKWLSNKKT